MPENDDMLSNRTVMLLSAAVMTVVVIMVAFVVDKAKQKPQSPQAMMAAAIREWAPGMGPQPFMYHPAAQTTPAWQPLPQAAAPVALAAPLAQRQSAPNWQPLPTAQAPQTSAATPQQQQPIRAYRGPVQ